MRKIALLLFALTGCASGGPRLSQMSADELLQRGLDRAEAGKWNDAAAALEQFIFQFPTHDRYQEARYRLGEVYMGRKDFLTAAAEFSRLADDYPTGELADDARFKVCDAYYNISPAPDLDQEYTQTAMLHCESLLSYFPDSEYAPRARQMYSDLQNKLAEKILKNGEYYLSRKGYDSAIIYFDDVLEQYPTSSAAPKALYALYKAYTDLGYVEDAAVARDRLVREFPDSPEAKRVEGDAAGRSS